MTTIPMALVGVDHPHAEEWHRTLTAVPELVPVAHYDPHPSAAMERLAPPYDGLPVYGDLAKLLARHPVQAALVMLPLEDAENALLTLARAGVHIMAEKPVARTAQGLVPAVAALQPETVFYAGYGWRFHPVIRQIRSLIEDGILGQLWSVEMHWITSRVGRREGEPAHRDPQSYLFRRQVSRGGMLQWLGCHFLDLMMYVTQQPVTSVMAMTAQQTSDEIEVEDTATCLLQFPSGLLGSLHVGYLLPGGGQIFLGLRGSLGWVHWDALTGQRFTVCSEHPDWVAAPRRVFDFPQPSLTTYAGGTGELLLRDFVRCIDQQGADPAYTATDALHVLKVLDAAYESADRRQMVSTGLDTDPAVW
jgi:predicted dehydrogenase